MQPHYEKVARLFNGPDAVHPGIVLMTRVDCASKVYMYCLLDFFLYMLWSYSTPFKLFCSAQKITCFHKYLNWAFFGKLYICTNLKEKKDEGNMCILLYGIIIRVSFVTARLDNVFEGNTLIGFPILVFMSLGCRLSLLTVSFTITLVTCRKLECCVLSLFFFYFSKEFFFSNLEWTIALVWEDHFIKCLLKLYVFLIDKYMFICL